MSVDANVYVAAPVPASVPVVAKSDLIAALIDLMGTGSTVGVAALLSRLDIDIPTRRARVKATVTATRTIEVEVEIDEDDVEDALNASYEMEGWHLDAQFNDSLVYTIESSVTASKEIEVEVDVPIGTPRADLLDEVDINEEADIEYDWDITDTAVDSVTWL